MLIAFDRDHTGSQKTVDELLERAGKGSLEAVAGLSTPRRNLGVALREAEAALRLARAAGPGTRVSHDFGPLRFLLDAPDTGEMVALVRSQLGAIADHDGRRGDGEILSTLRCYLELGTRPAVAQRCHIHVSTVKYRMQKVADLLGRSLSDPHVRFELVLAFEIMDVLGALGIHPLANPDPAGSEAVSSPSA